MIKILKVAAPVLLGLLLLGLTLRTCSGHGHVDELLEVTVRIVEGKTGDPLDGAVVATVRYESLFERGYLERRLREALLRSEDGDKDRWRGLVCATRTTAAAETSIRSSVYVTRYFIGSVETGKKIIVPRFLLVEHPRHGRIRVPIDPESELEEGDAPGTWRLDVGTIRLPGG